MYDFKGETITIADREWTVTGAHTNDSILWYELSSGRDTRSLMEDTLYDMVANKYLY